MRFRTRRDEADLFFVFLVLQARRSPSVDVESSEDSDCVVLAGPSVTKKRKI